MMFKQYKLHQPHAYIYDRIQEVVADLAKGMSILHVANKYSVARSTIQDVKTGRYWRNKHMEYKVLVEIPGKRTIQCFYTDESKAQAGLQMMVKDQPLGTVGTLFQTVETAVMVLSIDVNPEPEGTPLLTLKRCK